MFDHKIYGCEAKARVKRSHKKLLAEDYRTLTDREKVLMETAYRRGYFHGWWFCYKAKMSGFSLETIYRFIFSSLAKWRNARHSGQLVLPPELFARSASNVNTGEQ